MTHRLDLRNAALGSLAFLPLVFMSREIGTGNFDALNTSNADVLGSGTLLIFILMMLVTPMQTVTGKRWFTPLRWFYGVMMFATAAVDLIIASIVTGSDFKGGFLGRIAGHSFLVAGLTAVLLLVPLTVTANRSAQKRLGRYWKPLQRWLTYAVWLLIGVHLLLLFGLRLRLFQFVAMSLPLLLLRLPPVRKWWTGERKRLGWKAGVLWAAGLLLAGVFAWGFQGMAAEFTAKGLQALLLKPQSD